MTNPKRDNVVELPIPRTGCGGMQVPYNVGRTSTAPTSKIASIELTRMRSVASAKPVKPSTT